MRRGILIVALLAVALCRADVARAEYRVVPDPQSEGSKQLIWAEPGKEPVVIEEADVIQVMHSDWHGVVLNETRDAQKPAMLIFDGEGKPLHTIYSFVSRETEYMSLSPGKDILAIDSGIAGPRAWSFLKLPEGTLLNGPIVYLRGSQYGDMELVWMDNTTVMFPALAGAIGGPPSCPSLSGAYLCEYSLRDYTFEFVAEDTPRCEQYLKLLEAMEELR